MPNTHLNIVSQKVILDINLLLVIMSHISSRRDILPMMQTCRILYDAGCKHLLTRFPVNFNWHWPEPRPKIASFCQFMLAGSRKHFRYFRQLSFSGTHLRELPVLVVEEFAKVLHEAHCLQDLRILDYQLIVEVHPQISEALYSLSDLRYLTLDGSEDETCKLLQKMHSPLFSLDITCLPSDCESLRNFTPYLSPFSATLEKVQCHFPIIGLSGTHPCPKVHDLTVDGCRVTDIGTLFHCFPNLRTFTQIDNEDWDFGDVEVEGLRARNLATQARHTWQHMDRISGDLGGMYVLAPMFHVHHMDVYLLYRDTVRMLDALVQDTTPSHLSSTMNIGEAQFNAHDVPRLLQRVHPQVGRFTLSFRLSTGEPHDVEGLINGVLALLPFLPDMVRLDVCIDWTYLFYEPGAAELDSAPEPVAENPPEPQLQSEKLLYDYLQRIDHASLARRVMLASPSVEYVGLEISGSLSSKSDFRIVEVETGSKEVRELLYGIDVPAEDSDQPWRKWGFAREDPHYDYIGI